jgi:hypothetical protein
MSVEKLGSELQSTLKQQFNDVILAVRLITLQKVTPLPALSNEYVTLACDTTLPHIKLEGASDGTFFGEKIEKNEIKNIQDVSNTLDHTIKSLLSGLQVEDLQNPVHVFSKFFESNPKFGCSGELIVELSDIVADEDSGQLNFYFPIRFIGQNGKKYTTSFVLNYNTILGDFVNLSEFFYSGMSFQGAGFGKIVLGLINEIVSSMELVNGVVLNAYETAEDEVDDEKVKIEMMSYYQKQGFKSLTKEQELYDKVDKIYTDHFGNKNFMYLDLAQKTID